MKRTATASSHEGHLHTSLRAAPTPSHCPPANGTLHTTNTTTTRGAEATLERRGRLMTAGDARAVSPGPGVPLPTLLLRTRLLRTTAPIHTRTASTRLRRGAAHLPDLVHDLLRVPGRGGLHAPGEPQAARLHRLRLTVGRRHRGRHHRPAASSRVITRRRDRRTGGVEGARGGSSASQNCSRYTTESAGNTLIS